MEISWLDITGIVSGILGVIAGGTGFLYYRKEQKKRDVETESISVKTLNEAIEALSNRSISQETLIQNLRDRIDALEKEADDFRNELTALKLEKGELVLKNRRLREQMRIVHGQGTRLYGQIKAGLGNPITTITPLCELLGDE